MLMALLAMGVLYFVTVQLESVSLYQREAQRGGGSSSLGQAKEALLGYPAIYRDTHPDPSTNRIVDVFGYLPCPDLDGDGSGDSLEADCGARDGKAVIGLLPFKQLGLPSNQDGNGNCLWYAVSGTFKASAESGGLHRLPTPMNWDTLGQLEIRDSADALLTPEPDPDGRAAAVIFSVGPPLANQNNRLPVSDTAPCGVSPSNKADTVYTNYIEVDPDGLNRALSQPFPGPALATVWRVVQGTTGSSINNDRLAWITPKEIFDRVANRKDFSNALTATPAGQINTLIDRLAKALEKKIQDDIFDGGSSSLPKLGYDTIYTPQPTGIAMGDVDADTDISLTSDAANGVSYANYLTNWSDQLRQIRCNSVSTACLDINNSGTANCRGALLFSGRTSTGQPRTSIQKIFSPSTWITNLDYYFETAGSALLKGSSTSFYGRTAYAEAVSLAGASWSGGTATVTTSSAHGFGADFYVTISGVSPSGYNGTYRIAVTDTTHFTFALGSNPGTYVSGGSASSSSADVAACLGYGTFVSLKNDAAQFASGTITPGGSGIAVAGVTGVGGASPEIVLGSTTPSSSASCVWYPTALSLESSLRVYFKYRIDSATAGSSARGYALALADAATNSPYRTDPLMCGARGTTRLGYAGAPGSGTATVLGTTQTIAASSWSYSSGRATITAAIPHGFTGGQTVTIAGASPTGYNGTYTISFSGLTSTSFQYTVAYPGPPRAGIAPPKIGVEFDTNPEILTTQRNDPSAEHFAFLYWGSSGDNNMAAASTTRDGSDDNYHGDGLVGDGSQPLNPRSLTTSSATATALATVAAARWTGGTATITTSAPHSLANGQRIVVSDTSPLGYKGTYAASVTTLSVTGAIWTAGTATFTTSLAHNFSPGQKVVIAGVTPSGYNGTYVVTSVSDNLHLSVALATDPGGFVSGGLVNDATNFTYALASNPGAYPFVATIITATWAGSVATIATSAAHGLSTGANVTVSNASPSAWNGTYVVTVIDATHISYTLASNPGAYVSGGQVSYPLNWVNSASWSGGIVTMATAAAHNLVSNQYVTITGILPSGYNGTYRVTVTDSTHFTYMLTNPSANPGVYVSGGLVAVAGITSTVMAGTTTNILGTTWSTAGTVTVTTAAAHGLSIGQTVYVSGVTPAGYNGVYAVTSVPTTTSFIFSLANAGLAAGTAFGVVAVAAPASATISSAAWSSTNGGTATLATTAAHGFTNAQAVNIGGISPGGYNGAYAITVIDATHFSYALATDPGGSFTAATFATPGIATVKSGDLLLPYNGTMPLDTDIHVRLDVGRSYDASKHQATVTLRAYIGDNFSTGNCGLADFKNFARDLSELCPSRTPTIEQNRIVVNDVAGPALRNIYFGYSTARGASVNDNETIHIQNLILRSQ
jgi:hypothetical protein